MMINTLSLSRWIAITWMLLACTAGNKVKAQISYIDSLYLLVDTTTNDSLKAATLMNLAWEYSRRDPRKAIELADAGLALAKEINNSRLIAKSHYYFGAAYKNLGKFPTAKDHFDSLAIYARQELDSVLLANVLYQLAICDRGMHNLEGALAAFQEAQELYEENGDDRSVAMTLDAKAGVLADIPDTDGALQAYSEAKTLFTRVGDSLGLAGVLNNMGNVFAEIDSFEQALSCYNQQERIDQDLGQEWGLGYVYENRGRLYHKMGRREIAYTELARSIEIRRKYEHMLPLANTLNEMASMYLEDGSLAQAEMLLIEARQIAEDNQINLPLQESLKLLSDLYERQQDFPRALDFFRRYEHLKDSLNNARVSERIVELDKRFQNTRQRAEIDRLNWEMEEQLASLNRQRIIIGSVVLIALLLAGLIARILKQNRKIQAQHTLLNNTIHEKDTLLREIHHRVKNNLQVISSLLNIQSRRIEDETAREAIKEGRRRVQSMSLIHQNLYQHENLTGVDVKAYFDQLIDSLFKTYNVSSEQIGIVADIEALDLDVDTMIPLGLVINELISNALKYAFPHGRGTINVSIKEYEGALHLRIQDDGIGIKDPTRLEHSEGFGFALVRTFMKKLKADLQVESKDGTAITAVITNYRKSA